MGSFGNFLRSDGGNGPRLGERPSFQTTTPQKREIPQELAPFGSPNSAAGLGDEWGVMDRGMQVGNSQRGNKMSSASLKAPPLCSGNFYRTALRPQDKFLS
jgi:hypothetical protein